MPTRIFYGLPIVFICVIFSTSVSACLNTYDEELIALMHGWNPEVIQEHIAEYEAAYAKDSSIENGNDLAVAYIWAKQFDKAIELLRKIEDTYPGKAKTAANLGTALELSGNDVEAQHWIEEGIKRDPLEHDGTEWLHVKILHAKQAVAANPNWLLSHNVLGISFGDKEIPRQPVALPTDHSGNPIPLKDALTAIRYQLLERLQFVSKPDLLVADLFAARGDLFLLLKMQSPTATDLDEYSPSDYYQAALDFGVINEGLVKSRLEYAKRLEVPPSSPVTVYLWIALSGGVAVMIGFVLYRRRRRSLR